MGFNSAFKGLITHTHENLSLLAYFTPKNSTKKKAEVRLSRLLTSFSCGEPVRKLSCRSAFEVSRQFKLSRIWKSQRTFLLFIKYSSPWIQFETSVSDLDTKCRSYYMVSAVRWRTLVNFYFGIKNACGRSNLDVRAVIIWIVNAHK